MPRLLVVGHARMELSFGPAIRLRALWNARSKPFSAYIAGCAAVILSYQVSAADASTSVTLSNATAVDLRGQLASVPSPDLLDVLTLRDAAVIQSAIAVQMRDGIELDATLIRPKQQSGRLPVILVRTPYKASDEMSAPLAMKLIPELVRAGYAVVMVNDRGTQWSQGTYHWLKGANRDGYDILDWIVKQSWSDGKVGTFGCSSSAESQPGMATLNHPAHKAMVEMAGATGLGDVPGYTDQGAFYVGGVPNAIWAYWYRSFGHIYHPQLPAGMTPADRTLVARTYSPEPLYAMADVNALMGTLPSADILRVAGTPPTEWDRLIRLPPGSPEWNQYDFVREKDKTSVPGLHIDSWYDLLEAYPTEKLYQALAKTSPNQHLVMGPTAHCLMGAESEHTSVGRDVGDARFDYVSLIKAWFDEWLRDRKPPAVVPTIQYYVLNSNHWESAPIWPPPGGKAVRLFLDSSGRANSVSGDGRLVEKTAASSSSGSDTFVYDPLHPVSSPGDCCTEAASRDQSATEARQDVLVYTTQAYPRTLRLVGDVTITLSVSTSVRDTDLVATLLDVYPDGRAYNLSDTALRLRYRNGVKTVTFMEPDRIYPVTLHGILTAADILPGHRLRIELTSSNFPNLERNLNTGGNNFDESSARAATTRIVHDATHPSFIEFNEFPAPPPRTAELAR